MCRLDWNLFNGAIAAIANLVMAIIAFFAAFYAYQQIREASNARLTQIALQVNSDIQNYRNATPTRKIREKLLAHVRTHPDNDKRREALLRDPEIKDIWEYMARMNNLCWTMNRLPRRKHTDRLDDSLIDRDSIFYTIANNLVKEWECVKPLVEHRRSERRTQKLDDSRRDWYMRDFESAANYAREHLLHPV